MATTQTLTVLVIVALFRPATLSFSPVSAPPPSPDEDPRLCKQEGEYCFSYDPNSIVGPQNWYRVCGTFRCFFGANQSPIFINRWSVEPVCGHQNKLRYDNAEEVDGILENDGYYAKFRDIEFAPALLGVPGFHNTGFVLNSIHVHMGQKGSARGSEHVLSGQTFDAEVHLVHTRGAASAEVGGIAVVALFLSTTTGEHNSELSSLLDRVVKIQKYEGLVCRNFFTNCDQPEIKTELIEEAIMGNGAKLAKLIRDLNTTGNGDGSECGVDRFKNLDYLSALVGANSDNIAYRLAAIADAFDRRYCTRQEEICPRRPMRRGPQCGGVHLSISPDQLLPRNRNYYYYYGSLTTPTVSESVVWNLMATPLRITHQQLEALQSLESRTPGTPISAFGNLRPLQRLREREVFLNTCG